MTALHPPAAPARSWLADRRVWTALGAQTLFGLGWSSYLILPTFLAGTLHADATTIGRVTATAGFASLVTMAVITTLIDRIGRRHLFRAGILALIGASAALLAVEEVGPLVYVAQGAIGAAFVLTFNATAAIVTDLAPATRTGQAIGVLGATNMATNALSAAIAEQVALSTGWDVVFAGVAALGVLALAASALLTDAPASTDTGPPVRISQLFSRPLVAVFFASALSGGTFAALFTFHQPFALALGASRVADFFVGFTVTAVAMRVGLGSLGDLFGRRRVAALALVLYAFVALAAANLQVEWLFAYGAAFGVAHGVAYPTANALGVELAPQRARGRVIALFNGAFNAGFGLSALGLGEIADARGYPSVFFCAAAMAVVATVSIAVGTRSTA